MFGARRIRSPLEQLAIQWSLFGQLLVVFARQVVLADKLCASGGIRKAELLEAAIYAALIQLSAEIARAKPRGEKDRAALAHLKTVHALLSVMALMVRQLKADFQARVDAFAALSSTARERAWALPDAQIGGPGFLDSS